jgi:small subunit ribosomal protein S8
VLDLKYGPDGEFVIREITRVSKPGCRVYASTKKLPRVLRGQGIYVLSTPKGVLSDRNARLSNVGGEVLCKIH